MIFASNPISRHSFSIDSVFRKGSFPAPEIITILPEDLAHDLLLHGAEVGVVAVAEGEVEEGGVGGELVAELGAAHALHHRHEPAPPAPRPHRTPLLLVL